MTGIPYIPDNLTVHLGSPDEQAANVTVSFPDYIKNVASSEIYSTWPPESLRANIYAQISFALNRFYTEWYPSRGYNFDITSSTQYDQKFINNRNIYDVISELVDEIFNDYLRKKGTVNPLFSEYCNGTTVTCDGLSQWGTVDLAKSGKTAIEIVRHYYGEDVELIENTGVGENVPSYPGVALELGDLGEDVRRMQINMNRISTNYPAIPKIPVTDGAFGRSTKDAVVAFQKIFKLTADGVIGKATWYKVINVYNSVKKLAELTSEGIRLSEIPKQFREPLSLGDRGGQVSVLQYFLSFIAKFDDKIPETAIDGIFGPATENAVKAFQLSQGLVPDGIVGDRTWTAGYRAYKGIIDLLKLEITEEVAAPYPGVVLDLGSNGTSVAAAQEELDYLSKFIYELPPLKADGAFGSKTQGAVKLFQKVFNLPVTGKIDEATWNKLAEAYIIIKLGDRRLKRQFPGYIMEQG